ncbi:MAG: SET domain-containing protein-lysine N-methyltransferase [Herpetosiphonaceae bacterium]|nr:SET domain-containing protein-lysine N-methyltransferase [Herpetosiphonaceae bacterium]
MNYRTEPVTMWFDRRLVMRKSPIHGTGTFATEDIRAGEALIWVTGGIVYTPEDWHSGQVQLEPDMYNEERLGENLLIATPKSFHYYINHSCEPNAIDQSHHPTWTHYIALRDIRANEEITANYIEYGDPRLEVCACKSPGCRWTQHV